MTIETLHLRYFDVDASIHTDSPHFLWFLQRMYQSFVLDGDYPVGVEYALYTGSANPWGRPVLVMDGKIWNLDQDGVLEVYAYDGIMTSILAKVRTHYLIHAAALSLVNKGMALVADAGQGKTTLTLELLGRGFHFLSDELAVICKQSSRLQAFPRRLRVRPETLDMLNLRNKAENAPLVFGKYLLDIEDIFPGRLDETADLGYLFLMENVTSRDLGLEYESEAEMEVYVNRIDDDLLSALRAIPGVTGIDPDVKSGFPVIRVRARRRGDVILEIERICAMQDVLVMEISKRKLLAPIFHREASLEPISTTQAVMGLLRQFMPGHHSALIQQDFGGSSTRLFIELARCLEHTKCYRLNMGPLQQTADLICNLISP